MRILYTIILALAILVSPPMSGCGTVALGGHFRSPSGRQFNGTIRFSLPFAGAVDTNCDGGGSCLALPLIVSARVVNGVFDPAAPAPLLIRNGDITPAGTYYRAYVYDSVGGLVSASNFVIPVAVGSFDVGAALQTSITTNNVSYINPANLSGNNTWSGTNTFNGPVVFNSTVTGISFPCGASAPANTVCGNNTGAPTGPSYVKTTFSMTDGTTIAPINSPTFTGVPQAPTPATGDNSNKIATTAFVNAQVGSVAIIAKAHITSCALAANGGEWNCTGTLNWGLTLPNNTYSPICQLGIPLPTVSYPIPAGYQAAFKINPLTMTTTTIQYEIDDDHSGSLGAVYDIWCEALQ